MSVMPHIFDAYDVTREIPSVMEKEKRRAEKTGKQWAGEITEKLDEGLAVWKELVSRDMQITHSEKKAELFGIAIAALEEGKVRDCVLMHACEGTLERLGEDSSADYIEDTFVKLEESAPVMRDIETVCAVLKQCCAYASSTQGYPFAMLAYLLWWTGKIRSAYENVDRALERDSRNSLAQLLLRILNAGVTPPWLARKCGAFHIKALE